MNPKRYCELASCQCRDKKLPPFKGDDRKVRFLHKKCLKQYDRDWIWCQETGGDFASLIKPNPLNKPINKCLACGGQVKDTKNGYCETHNYMPNWVTYG